MHKNTQRSWHNRKKKKNFQGERRQGYVKAGTGLVWATMGGPVIKVGYVWPATQLWNCVMMWHWRKIKSFTCCHVTSGHQACYNEISSQTQQRGLWWTGDWGRRGAMVIFSINLNRSWTVLDLVGPLGVLLSSGWRWRSCGWRTQRKRRQTPHLRPR